MKKEAKTKKEAPKKEPKYKIFELPNGVKVRIKK